VLGKSGWLRDISVCADGERYPGKSPDSFHNPTLLFWRKSARCQPAFDLSRALDSFFDPFFRAFLDFFGPKSRKSAADDFS